MRPSKPFNWENGVPMSGQSTYDRGWDSAWSPTERHKPWFPISVAGAMLAVVVEDARQSPNLSDATSRAVQAGKSLET